MNGILEMMTGWLHHSAFTAAVVDSWLKSVAVLAVAGCVCWGCRRAAAATRHWIWFLALASLPCLLWLSAVPRAWHRPLWPIATSLESGNQVSVAFSPVTGSGAVRPNARRSPAANQPATPDQIAGLNHRPAVARFSVMWLAMGVAVWVVGTLASLLFVLAGRIQLRRLARQGIPLAPGSDTLGSERTESDWDSLLREACDRLRLHRFVRLLQSQDNSMPLTWGSWRPVVLLPAEAAEWPVERRRIVLLHELAHVKRWDCLTQGIAQLVCVFYWLNPLAWLAARRMCIERERACDDLVLNSGCKATDYASHLVDIARAFRRAPRFAGIAMARSAQLQERIAAIVDVSRARRLRPLTALASLLLMGLLAVGLGGRSQDAAVAQPWDSPLRHAQIARLEQFSRAKGKQSQELAANAGEQISPQFQAFFNAATSGDWQTVTNRYEYYKLHHGQYSKGTNAVEENLRTAYWQPVLEICLAYDQVVNCDPKYTALLADGIINSIPPGSICFGGTDPGRGVPTAFCKSQIDADPFFTLTQNALADGTYLQYLRAMYGGKIYTPTDADSQSCFQEYLAGAQSRLAEHKLKPGEDVRTVNGKVIVSGQVAVMNINGLLTKVIFDHNPDREFYIEESFPLDWMYPYLEPHGLILKINRHLLPQLPATTLAQDREYWRKLVAGMLGDWLKNETPVSEVAAFVDRVYVQGNLQGFTGDPGFIASEPARKLFAKLRSAIGGVYRWRLQSGTPAEYRPPPGTQTDALAAEAELAFRQAYAICPESPEALFRYVDLLLQLNRVDDAILLAQTSRKLDAGNAQVQALVESLKQCKAQQSRAAAATNTVAGSAGRVRYHVLASTDAEALAVRLANQKAQALYHRQPFQSGRMPEFVDGYWVWHDSRAFGAADLEATVKFKEDGSEPEVNVTLQDSRGIVR